MITVIIPSKGIGTPDTTPIKNALPVFVPFSCIGSDTKRASGIFCTAIAIARTSAVEADIQSIFIK